jgi:hypothetical protein
VTVPSVAGDAEPPAEADALALGAADSDGSALELAAGVALAGADGDAADADGDAAAEEGEAAADVAAVVGLPAGADEEGAVVAAPPPQAVTINAMTSGPARRRETVSNAFSHI